MTVVHKFLDEFSLNLVWVCQPFRLTDLLASAVEHSERDGKETHFTCPLLLDLRQIDLLEFEVQDFTRLIWERSQYKKSVSDVPSAFVAKDEASFGMLRLYGAYAEFNGLRGSKNFLATYDMQQAVSWILQHLDIAPEKGLELQQSIDRHCHQFAMEYLH